MRLVKNFLAFVIFIFSFSIFVSCGRNIDTGISENKEIRIVSLAPSNTEILVGLDLGNNIIGIDQYSEGIKGVSENIQVFEIGVPNIEAVLKLNPTHLLLSGYTSDLSKYVELENSGVKVINIDTPTSIQGIYDSIELIGKSFNSVSKSKEISQAPYLYSFGRSTYLNEIIELSGGENIFGNLEGWISPSEESIIKANPQIIFTNVNVERNIDEIKNRHGWENIDAVKNNRIYYIDKDMSSRASQFFLGALKDITRYIREYNDEV